MKPKKQTKLTHKKLIDKQTKFILKNFMTKDLFYKEMDNLNKLIDKLPTKKEFFDKVDEVLKAIRDTRINITLQSNRITTHTGKLEDHDERITKLEQLPILTA